MNNDALISEITQKNSLKCDQMEQENVFLQVNLYFTCTNCNEYLIG